MSTRQQLEMEWAHRSEASEDSRNWQKAASDYNPSRIVSLQ